MKHYFIQQKHLPRLTLFFAGWGMDECPFMDYCPENSDLLVCYDYRSLDFDFTLLQGYQEIRLIAWSMGVWAASMVLQDMDLPICERVALNGTVTPVDDLKGIPQQECDLYTDGILYSTIITDRRHSGTLVTRTSVQYLSRSRIHRFVWRSGTKWNPDDQSLQRFKKTK